MKTTNYKKFYQNGKLMNRKHGKPINAVDSRRLVEITFMISDDQITHSRLVFTIVDFLGSLGGISNLILGVFILMLSPFY